MIKLTRFERARILSARALQLSLGAPPLVKPVYESTPYTLAKQEFDDKVIPMAVLRRLPNNEVIKIEVI